MGWGVGVDVIGVSSPNEAAKINHFLEQRAVFVSGHSSDESRVGIRVDLGQLIRENRGNLLRAPASSHLV